jgi:hypothetical protein
LYLSFENKLLLPFCCCYTVDVFTGGGQKAEGRYQKKARARRNFPEKRKIVFVKLKFKSLHLVFILLKALRGKNTTRAKLKRKMLPTSSREEKRKTCASGEDLEWKIHVRLANTLTPREIFSLPN